MCCDSYGCTSFMTNFNLVNQLLILSIAFSCSVFFAAQLEYYVTYLLRLYKHHTMLDLFKNVDS